ncbi:4-galactosyl-N-acetylglucosaminide 3-alpha-L-fucosyltransferase FUT6-like [Mya arenaria]|uniref:4-galactosyl-N-acetylglucosaminide 3-alpha-L-fucosyltransferase FUT6-like n=1 Tax=Mya arenaria TaxID=6604 RepID=UPI0022E1A279|nr:4-galactosyl-N-acetylglucosaminide 3-alpha-L-fucosyltransferase FUT6-like [Mya arenaria]
MDYTLGSVRFNFLCKILFGTFFILSVIYVVLWNLPFGYKPVKATLLWSLPLYLENTDVETEHNITESKTEYNTTESKSEHAITDTETEHTITWYNLPWFINTRGSAVNFTFKNCKYKNCKLSLDRKDIKNSSAVLIDGRVLSGRKSLLKIERPLGQIWIYAAHESPRLYKKSDWINSPLRYVFNWTMFYKRENTDIHLPYGQLKETSAFSPRNFTDIALRKTDGALLITSHCPTDSRREQYIAKLKNYLPVEVLGSCGKPWSCGMRTVHDECFGLLNTTYAFYLAFENALCKEYFTEKLFENFDYDIIIVSRGGGKGDTNRMLPRDTIITTDDFENADDLGRYLAYVSKSPAVYGYMLRRKSRYVSVGYNALHERAMCQICEMINNVEKNRRTIDIYKWLFIPDACRIPYDI